MEYEPAENNVSCRRRSNTVGHQGFLANFGHDPSSSSFIPAGGLPFNSATWNFSPTIPDGHFSEILLFTSPFAPTMIDSSVQGGGLSRQSQLPSPVPEPGTVLAAYGMMGELLLRRRYL